MVAPLISMRALSGAAARLWYQAGMLAAPLADAAISQPPFPSETQPRGVVRSRPLLRPVVVRSRMSKSKPGVLLPLRSRLATKPLIQSMRRPLGCRAPGGRDAYDRPCRDHMQKAPSLFEKGPLALVAGVGFEPTTSGL